MTDILISHAVDDRPAAEAVAGLVARVGYVPWWDISSDAAADRLEEELAAALDYVDLVVALHSSRSHWSYEAGVATARARVLGKHLPCFLDVPQSVRTPGALAPETELPIDLSRMGREPEQLEALEARIVERLGAQTPPADDAALADLLGAAQREVDAWRAVAESADAAAVRRYLRSRTSPGPFDALARRRLVELHALDAPDEAAQPKIGRLVVGAAAAGAAIAVIGVSLWSGLQQDPDAAASALRADERLANLEEEIDLAQSRGDARAEDWVARVNALTSDVDAAGARTIHLEEALMALGDRVAAQAQALAAAERSLRSALATQDQMLASLDDGADAEAAALAEATRETLSAQSQAIDELRGLLGAQQDALAAMQERVGASADAEALAALRADIETLSASLEAAVAEADHEEQRRAIASLTDRVDAQAAALTSQAAALTEAEAREASARTALQEALQAFDDRLTAQSEAMTASEARRDGAAAELTSALDALDVRVERAEAAATEATAAQGESQAEFQALVDALRGDVTAELAGQAEAIAALGARQDETAAVVASLGDAAAGRDAALEALSDRQDETAAAVASLSEASRQRDDALVALEARQDAARAALETEVSALGDALREQNDAWAASSADLAETRAALEAALAALRDDLRDRTSALSTASARREAAHRNLDGVVAALRQDVDQQAATLNAVMAEIEHRDRAAERREASAFERLVAAPVAPTAAAPAPAPSLRLASVDAAGVAESEIAVETPAILSTPEIAGETSTQTPAEAAEAAEIDRVVSPVAATAVAIVAAPVVEDADAERRHAPAEPQAKTLAAAPSPTGSPRRPEVAVAVASSESAAEELAEPTSAAQTAPSAEQARAVKRLLARAGFGVGAAGDGWSEDAAAAMRAFEALAHLPASGVPTERATELLSIAPTRLFAGAKASIYFRETPASRAKAERYRKTIEAGGGDILNYRRIVALCENVTAPEKTHLGFSPGHGLQVEFLRAVFPEENTAIWEKRSGESNFLVAFCGD